MSRPHPTPAAPTTPSRWLDRRRFAAAGKRFPFSVSLLSWGLNEEENIVDFLERAKAFMDSLGIDYEHILIDDGSTDRTYALALEVKKRYPQLKIIKNPKNVGSGRNTRIAVAAATKEILFWQTVDWSYDISRVGEYLWLLRDYDVVQGVRIKRLVPEYRNFFNRFLILKNVRVTKRSDNFKKAIISVTNYLMIRTLFRVPLLDFQNVTLYPTALAQSLNFQSESAFTNPEMLLKSYWKGATIKQVPIGFIKRELGEAKGTRFKVVMRSLSQVMAFWFSWMVLGRRPDHLKGEVFPPSES